MDIHRSKPHKNHVLQAKYTHTIGDLKDLVEKSTKLGRVRDLVYKGAVLDDYKTVAQTSLVSLVLLTF